MQTISNVEQQIERVLSMHILRRDISKAKIKEILSRLTKMVDQMPNEPVDYVH